MTDTLLWNEQHRTSFTSSSSSFEMCGLLAFDPVLRALRCQYSASLICNGGVELYVVSSHARLFRRGLTVVFSRASGELGAVVRT